MRATPDDLGAIKDLSFLLGALPYLETECDILVERVVIRAIKMLEAGDFKDDEARALWAEVWAARTIKRRLQGRIKGVQAAATKAIPVLDGEFTPL